jgi:hypothetical protein
MNIMTGTDAELKSYLQERKSMAIKSFDEGEDTASRDIARIEMSSRLLHLSEFCFFQVSYEASFDHDIPEEYLLCIYDDYLFRNEVPDWARDFARYILACYYEADADAREFSLN